MVEALQHGRHVARSQLLRSKLRKLTRVSTTPRPATARRRHAAADLVRALIIRSALGTRCGSAYCGRTRITGENANGNADDEGAVD